MVFVSQLELRLDQSRAPNRFLKGLVARGANHLVRPVCAALLAAASCLVAATASAQGTITWNLSNSFGATTLQGEGDLYFADLVAKRSNGRMKIVVHTGGSLGYKSQDHFDLVTDNVVEVANTPGNFLGGVDQLLLLSSLPFVARTTDDARRLLALSASEYDKIFRKGKQQLLYVSPWPASGIWARKPLGTAADLKSLKVRTFDPVGSSVFTATGAAPVQVAWGDVMPLLATNALDAVLTSADGGVSVKMWEYAPYFNDINYAVPLNFVHVNSASFEKLPADLKEIVKQAAKEAQERNWSNIQSRVGENFAALAKEKGQVIKGSDSLMAVLQNASGPIIADWEKKTGGRGKAILDQFRAGK